MLWTLHALSAGSSDRQWARGENPPLQRRAPSWPVHSPHHHMERGCFGETLHTRTQPEARSTHTWSRAPLPGFRFFQDVWIKWHFASWMSSQTCCFLWRKIKFWQAKCDYSIQEEHWCGKWWWKRGNFLQSRSNMHSNTGSPSGVLTPCFQYRSERCPLCPTKLVATGGSLHGLISTRTDVKNVHVVFQTHGSDQASDLRATCNH